jgi:isoquinoline 1-oxidoreductase beta subunit
MRVNLNKLGSFDFTRREMFKLGAGAFLLGGSVAIPRMSYAQETGPAPGPFDPHLFLRIDADSTVTLLSKHLEMGQAATTGLATMVAEELGVDWKEMRFEHAPNNAAVYNNLLFGPVMGTGGSTSVANSWDQLRQVGAAARIMFIDAAAAQWGAPAREIAISNGMVRHAASGRTASLGSLAAAAMQQPVPQKVTLKAPAQWSQIGKAAPRLDSVVKTTGRAIYASDVRFPGMLRAVVRRPELFGAKVKSFDATAAKKVAGVVDVVQIPAGIAVLAKDTWAAIKGREALKVTWDTSAAETRSSSGIWTEYRTLAKSAGLPALARGEASAATSAARKVEAEFRLPYLAHAPMEPLDCVLQFHGDSAELWSGCQLQSIDQLVAAQVLGLTEDKIKIHTVYAGGSFGRRGNPMGDWVVELASIAKVYKQRVPIQLVWSREDDLQGGYYRPMALHHVTVGLTPQNRIAGWNHRVVSQSIFMNTPFERMAVNNGVDASSVEGIVDSPYSIGAMHMDVHHPKSPVTVLWWRSVGHSHTAFVMESMIDQLAQTAALDPVDFRLALLDGKPRDQAVVRLAAERSGWGTPLTRGRGRGFAYHFSFGTRVAMAAEVTLDGDDLASVDKIVAAVDCGVAVNPDMVTAQVEGAIGFALSTVLRNQVTLDEGKVSLRNFDDYEPTRMREMPVVEVHIVANEERPSGMGEPGIPPLAPAIANAVVAAGGRRHYALPFAS